MNRYAFNDAEHVHTLDGKPLMGTTSVLDIMGKTLTWWASGLACTELGWLKSLDKDQEATQADKEVRRSARISSANAFLLKLKAMDGESYLKLLDQAYKAHSVRLKDTAVEGVDLHQCVEDYIKGKMAGTPPLFEDERLKAFIAWCDKNVKEFLFSEVYTYSERLWVGGGPDFAYVSMNGKTVLADVKSSPKAYYNHFCQIGAYDIQLSESGAFTANGDRLLQPMKPFDAHAVFHFGGGFKEPSISWGTTRNKRSFEAALQLYKDKADFEEVMA